MPHLLQQNKKALLLQWLLLYHLAAHAQKTGVDSLGLAKFDCYCQQLEIHCAYFLSTTSWKEENTREQWASVQELLRLRYRLLCVPGIMQEGLT